MSQVGLYSKKVGAQDLTAALSVFWGFYSPMNCSLVPLVVGTCVLSLFNPQWNSLHFLRLLHDQNQGVLCRDDRDFIVPDFWRRLYVLPKPSLSRNLSLKDCWPSGVEAQDQILLPDTHAAVVSIWTGTAKHCSGTSSHSLGLVLISQQSETDSRVRSPLSFRT